MSDEPTLTPAEVTWALMKYYKELGALMPTAADLFRLAGKPLFVEEQQR